MSLQWFYLLLGNSGYRAAIVLASLIIILKLSRRSKLDAIPTVGSSSWLGSWRAGLMFPANALDVMQEGYGKHRKAPFKLAAFYRWLVIFSDREHIEELRRAPDDTLSFQEGLNDVLQIEYTMGHQVHSNPYHNLVLRSQLTRNLRALYPEVRTEIAVAFDDILGLKGNGWKSIPVLHCAREIVCRVSNRVFVGLPLCRNPDWIDLNIQYTIRVIEGAIVTTLFPTFLKPLAARLFTRVVQSNHRGTKLLGPLIEERRKYLNEYGNEWADKPNDLLSWLMDEAEGEELTVEALTSRMLASNFGAIHTTSSSFTNTLFYLAANTQYIQPLREEVEAVIQKDGWTKAALVKMYKVDSFLKECQRIEGFNGVSMPRKALKDFTFSDGTFVPKGTCMMIPAQCIHHDETFYPNARVFKPFRFADMRRENGETLRHQYISTTTEYLPFGHGRHSCPGRFFAASELKTMLAHVVVMYDIKLEDNMPQPRTFHLGGTHNPDPNAKVMFRRRVG